MLEFVFISYTGELVQKCWKKKHGNLLGFYERFFKVLILLAEQIRMNKS